MPKLFIPFISCQRCGHNWRPRKPHIIRCSACNSLLWDVPLPIPSSPYEKRPPGRPRRYLSSAIRMAMKQTPPPLEPIAPPPQSPWSLPPMPTWQDILREANAGAIHSPEPQAPPDPQEAPYPELWREIMLRSVAPQLASVARSPEPPQSTEIMTEPLYEPIAPQKEQTPWQDPHSPEAAEKRRLLVIERISSLQDKNTKETNS